MAAARIAAYLLGLALVVTAVWMLLFETGLNRWIPYTVAIIAILLIVGVAIMGASERMPVEHPPFEEHDHGHGGHH